MYQRSPEKLGNTAYSRHFFSEVATWPFNSTLHLLSDADTSLILGDLSEEAVYPHTTDLARPRHPLPQYKRGQGRCRSNYPCNYCNNL